MAERRSRDQLLDQIVAIIMAEGFAHLKVGEIASRLRCSRSTIYALAPSKDEVFVLALNRLADRAQEEALGASSAPGLSAAERIIAYTQTTNEWQNRCSMQLWADINAIPAAAAAFAEQNAEGVDVVEGYIEDGVRTGEFRRVNAKFHAHIIRAASAMTRDPEVLRETGMTSGEAMAELGRAITVGLGT